MRVMSTLKTVCTCALVCLDSTMRSAIFLRIGVIGTSSPGIGGGMCAAADAAAAGRAGAVAARTGPGAVVATAAEAAAAGGGGPPLPSFFTQPRVLVFVMGPPTPGPAKLLQS